MQSNSYKIKIVKANKFDKKAVTKHKGKTWQRTNNKRSIQKEAGL